MGLLTEGLANQTQARPNAAPWTARFVLVPTHLGTARCAAKGRMLGGRRPTHIVSCNKDGEAVNQHSMGSTNFLQVNTFDTDVRAVERHMLGNSAGPVCATSDNAEACAAKHCSVGSNNSLRVNTFGGDVRATEHHT